MDEDGWGLDAPQVTRSQLEKVAPAYQPTKVNMAELTKQKEPSSLNGGNRVNNSEGDVVRGAYQPVGKVDIAALRAQSQKAGDDRPSIVKGAYEPVGKVDIAAIRARAQKPSDDGPQQLPPTATGASATSDMSEEGRPKSLSDRSSAFTQSERLTSLPKPKVANRFGSNASNFSGTQAPTPGVFGLQSAPPTVASPPVGAAKTYADEGGKTPAQVWAEKRARQRGLSGVGDAPSVTAPIASQTSGGGEWKSGYAGKSWAPVATTATGKSGSGSIGQQRTGEEEYEEKAPSSPAGGVGALRDRFKGGAPMGALSMARDTTAEKTPPAPSINSSTRPPGGIPMPGLPSRTTPADDEEEDDQGVPNIPPPPRVQRSPTPPTPEERDTSPARIAMPVARSKDPVIEAPEERNDPPVLPTQIGRNVPHEEDLTEEPVGHDPARGAGAAVAAASFGDNAGTTNQGSGASGKRAVVQYDYEKAEDNELELIEGEHVTNIEMVDDDWWMGTNQKGESGLFPSNYVELVAGDDEESPAVSHDPEPVNPARAPAAPAASSGPTAKALYDYEAAEDNELSFPEEATITGMVGFLQLRLRQCTNSRRNFLMMTGGLVTMAENPVSSRPTMCSWMIEVLASAYR